MPDLDPITQGSLAALAASILLRAIAKLAESVSAALSERATSRRLDSQRALVEAEAGLVEAEATGRHALLAEGYRVDARSDRDRLIGDLATAHARIVELEHQLEAMRAEVERWQRAVMSGGVYPHQEE